MGSIDIAVRFSRELESALAEHFSAEGRGLHEKLSNVQESLPVSLTKKLRWIATLRNKVVHEHNYDIDNIEDYKLVCEECLAGLNEIVFSQKNSRKGNSRIRKSALQLDIRKMYFATIASIVLVVVQQLYLLISGWF